MFAFLSSFRFSGPARLLIAGALVVATSAVAQGWETGSDGLAPIPPLHARVTDLTNTLPPSDQQAIEAKLAAWERDTGIRWWYSSSRRRNPSPSKRIRFASPKRGRSDAKDRTTACC